MDWTVPLRSQQLDFMQRLKLGSAALLHCPPEGCYSELIALSGEWLESLQETCWQVVKQQRQHSSADIHKSFVHYFPAQLSRAAIADWLGSAVTEVDPENRLNGASEIDFTLTADPTVSIRVKACQSTFEAAQWVASSTEMEANTVFICVLVQEAIREHCRKYTLVVAGFLPADLMSNNGDRTVLKIPDLLYGGGLRSYLEFLQADRVTDLASAQTHYRQGTNHYEQKEFQQALTAYNQAIQLNPHLDEAYYERGRTYYEIGNHSEALKDFDRALHINSDYGKAYLSRGLVRRRLKDYRGAIKDFNQALHFRPNHAKAYMNRGLARCDLGDYEGAIEDCNQALHIDAKFAEAYSIRGMMRSRLGDKKGAIEDWNQALKADPNHPRAYFYRGFARCGLGDYQNAIADYDQALRIDPNFAEAHYYQGITYAKLGKFQAALENLQRATKLFFTQGRMDKYKEAMNKIDEIEKGRR